jgi:RNA polymerase sigma factor (TIGR02999 family)
MASPPGAAFPGRTGYSELPVLGQTIAHRVANSGNRANVLAMSDATRILEALAHGDPTAADELLPLVYDELRKLAAHKMAGQAPGHTLQPTALVHEAWLRLAGSQPGRFAGRAHFFAVAAEAMRHILIDSARRKRAARHGGGQVRVELQDVEIASLADADELLAVHDALDKLAAEDPKKAELAKLRYFVGMTFGEAAEVLGISVATAKRHWTYARAFLYEEIKASKKN